MVFDKEKLIEAIKSIRNGSMARICYRCELPMKAEFDKQGYKIYKTVETTARFGCNYNNLKSVIKKREDSNYKPSNKKNNFIWLVENKISRNTNTGKDYVRFVPMAKGANRKATYTFEDSLGKEFVFHSDLPDDFKNLVQNSYWTKKPMPEVQTICLDNVLYIKYKNK